MPALNITTTMDITIDNFQEHVPSRIYWRGEEYYAGRAVTSLHKTSDGRWHATVSGTDDYNVYITIRDNGSLSWKCDCPYDGPMCKHVVATLLAMRERGLGTLHDEDEYIEDVEWEENEFEEDDYEEEWDDEDDYEDEDNQAEVDNNASAASDNELDRLIAVANKDDLADFLRLRASEDPALRNALINLIKSRYITPNKEDNTDYAKMVHHALQSCVRTQRTRYDYIDETDWDDVADKAYKLVEMGDKLLLAGNALAAVTIAVKVLETIDEMMDDSLMYDEDADIGGACEAAGNLLLKAINAPSLGNDQRRATIARVRKLTASELENYGYYDFSDLINQLSAKALDGDDAIALLNDMIADARNYQKDSYVLQKINLLDKLGRTRERDATIDEHIHIPLVRELRMNELTAAGRYADALRVIADGITEAQSDSPRGSAHDWLAHKMEVLGLMGDTAAQTDVARQLFLSGRDTMEYYHKLKQLVPAQQWKALLTTLLASNHKLSTEALARIYIEEKDFDQLLAMVSHIKYDRLNAIIRYAMYLRDTHSAELLQLLEHDIRDYADRNMGRDHYERLADALRVMRNLKGGREAAAALTADLCATYPRRRAMIDILRKPL